MTARKIKSLADFTTGEVLDSIIIRVRDGESTPTMGADLDAMKKLLANKRDGDAYYLMPKPAPLAAMLVPLRPHGFDPLRAEAPVDVFTMAFGRYSPSQDRPAPPPPKTPERRLAEALEAVRELRDRMLIELDDVQRPTPTDMLDDPADRYAQMELDRAMCEHACHRQAIQHGGPVQCPTCGEFLRATMTVPMPLEDP